jgi:hypothetical protein
LSTHPSDEQRIKDIQGYMNDAMKYYNKGNNSSGVKTIRN